MSIETAVVHVAEVAADALELGCSGESLVPSLDAAAWDVLGLPVGEVPVVLEEACGLLGEAARTLLGSG